MKKELTALCIAFVALNGCTDSDSQSKLQQEKAEDFSTISEALTGEVGGLPWGEQSTEGTTQSKRIVSSVEGNNHFGRAMAIGDFNGDGKADIATSQGGLLKEGNVFIKFGHSDYATKVSFTSAQAGVDANDDLGAALAVIQCSGIEKDVLVASAPTYSTETTQYNGALTFIYDSGNGRYPTRKTIYHKEGRELAGTYMTAGDINGDGKADLIYQSTPLNSNNAYLNPKISVLLDVCSKGSYNKKTDFTPDLSIEAESKTKFGSAIYIADLDKNGDLPEIIVVDNLFKGESPAAPAGAIYFYRYDAESKTLKPSRDPLIGDHNETSGASIESVAFSDIDGDGDLDLIVGEPMYITSKKREGRVRTYTNEGPGKAFDSADMKWSAIVDRTNARFGSAVHIADVNHDGVDDLIVGAPGFFDTATTKQHAKGYVYVYMGTKDGSIFSKAPFWTYASPESGSKNDDFGRHVAAVDMDGSQGWLDLVVAAPVNTSVANVGKIDIFNESNGYCYTANKCHVDNKCYDAQETSDNSKCEICDPTRNNFGFVEQTCEGVETNCHYAATCDAVKGCTMENKPDGTSCADTTCTSNSLTISTCEAGSCVPKSTECGSYVCNADLSACPTTCATDEDCVAPYVCNDGVCSEKINEAPSITMPEDATVQQGGSVKLTATAADPENDSLTYSWTCDNSAVKLTEDKTASLNVAVPAAVSANSTFTCTLTVEDSAGNTKSDSVNVTVTGINITIATPSNNASEVGPTISFTGKTTATQGSINIVYNDNNICTAPISKSGTWACQADMQAGKYTVSALWSENKAQKSNVTFTVTDPIPENNPPVISVKKSYHGTPGSFVTIDASKSYDPDEGDTITFRWSGPDAQLLNSTSSASPKFTIPSNAIAGSEYSITLTVKDSHDASVTEIVTIAVDSFNHNITIEEPSSQSIVTTPDAEISGKTTIPEGDHIVIVDVNTGSTLCTAEIQSDLTWYCEHAFVDGNYTIQASWEEGTIMDPTESEAVSFVVEIPDPNTAPVAVVAPEHFIEIGASAIIDASKSYDPDKDDTITYRWTGPGAEMLDDKTSATPTFFMPSDAEAETVYKLVLTVTDSHNASDTADIDVVATKSSIDYAIEMTKPENGSNVSNPVVFEGTATPGMIVSVSTDLDEIVCTTATVPESGTWSCQATMGVGSHTVNAALLDSETPVAKTSQITFTIEEEPIKPVITKPTNNEIIATRPTISGTMDADSGRVYVWTIDGAISTLLCSAAVKDNRWSCTAGYSLENSTKYTLQAYWKDGDVVSNMSDEVIVTTEDKEIPKIDIISPANGAKLDYNNPIVFAGKADPGTVVDVYTSTESDDVWTLTCTAIAHADGYWACQDKWLNVGEYLVVADIGKDEDFIPTEPVKFAIERKTHYASGVEGEDVRGGSCSMSTMPAGNFGWLFLLTGFAGFGLIRRRKSE